jgi:hypothetical protein
VLAPPSRPPPPPPYVVVGVGVDVVVVVVVVVAWSWWSWSWWSVVVVVVVVVVVDVVVVVVGVWMALEARSPLCLVYTIGRGVPVVRCASTLGPFTKTALLFRRGGGLSPSPARDGGGPMPLLLDALAARCPCCPMPLPCCRRKLLLHRPAAEALV